MSYLETLPCSNGIEFITINLLRWQTYNVLNKFNETVITKAH